MIPKNTVLMGPSNHRFARPKRKKSEHHRLPRVQGGTRKSPTGNIVKVDARRHEAWHTLFSSYMTTYQIAKELNDLWIDPRYRLVVEPTEAYLEELGEKKKENPNQKGLP